MVAITWMYLTTFFSSHFINTVGAFSPANTYVRTRKGILQMTNNDNKKNLNQSTFTVFLDRVLKTGLDNDSIKLNSIVVADYNIPELGVYSNQSYEVQSIYLQGEKKTKDEKTTHEGGIVEKIKLAEFSLNGGISSTLGRNGLDEESLPGYTLYVKIYNPVYHDNEKFGNQSVIVTPEEVGLRSMKDEVIESILVAVPILSFWLGTCFVFANTYNQKYGGNFVDALLGR